MPISVELPDQAITLDFPDDTPPGEMENYIDSTYYSHPAIVSRISDILAGAQPLEPVEEMATRTSKEKLRPQGWSQQEEDDFNDWYSNWAEETGINPNPDDPQHFYDYREAFRAGAVPTANAQGIYHWPSEFKTADHPNRYAEGIDTITGKPSQAQAEALAEGVFEGPVQEPITLDALLKALDYSTEMERRKQVGPELVQAEIEPKPKGWVAKQIRQFREKEAALKPEERAKAVMDLMDLEPIDRRLRYMNRLGNDIISGAFGIGEGFIGSAQWLLNSEIAKETADLGRELANNFAPEDPTFVDQLAMGAGSMAVFFIPGFGVMSATSRLAQAGQAGATLARWMGVGTSTAIEAMTEAGQSYREILEATKSRDKANHGATLSFLLNTALIGVTNKLGIYGETGRLVRKSILSGLMEGSQEAGQEIISAVVEGRPIDWKTVGISGSIGAILGPAVGMGEAFVERAGAGVRKVRREEERAAAKEAAGAPPAGKPKEQIPKEMGAYFVPVEEISAKSEEELPKEERLPKKEFANTAEAAKFGETATTLQVSRLRMARQDRLDRARDLIDAGQHQGAMEELKQANILNEAIRKADQPELFKEVPEKERPKDIVEEYKKPEDLFNIPHITQAAIKLKDGTIVEGDSHYEAWDKLSLEQRKNIADDEGFVDQAGKFYTREEAVKATGASDTDAPFVVGRSIIPQQRIDKKSSNQVAEIVRAEMNEAVPRAAVKSIGDLIKEHVETLGIGVAKFVEKPIMFKGKTFENPAMMGIGAQIARNPLFETFHWIYMKGTKCVAHEAISSRIPGQTEFHKGVTWDLAKGDIQKTIDRLGVDGVYVLHNHPSGNPTISAPDMKATEKIAEFLGDKFKGHIVIDSGTFGYLFRNSLGELQPKYYRLPGTKGDWKDKLLTPSKPHPFVNFTITKPMDILTMGEALQDFQNTFAAFYITGQNKVRALQVISRAAFEDFFTDELAEELRNQAKGFGASSVVLYGGQNVFGALSNKGRATLENLVKKGVLLDVIYANEDHIPLGLKVRLEMEAGGEIRPAIGMFLGEPITSKTVTEEPKQMAALKKIFPASEKSGLVDNYYSNASFKVDNKSVVAERNKTFGNETEQARPEDTPDWKQDNLNVLQLPELVRLVERLSAGKLPQVVLKFRKTTTRGVFIPGKGLIQIRADMFKDPVLAKKVLAHEIGHLIDWLPSKEMGRGNILGRIATLRRYLKQTLPHHPGAPGELTEADRRRLRLEAKRILEGKRALKQITGVTKLIDEIVEKEMPITAEDVLAIWNAVEKAKLFSPELYNYIATLDANAKKLIVKAALKGQVAAQLQQFAKKTQVATGRKIEVKEEIPEVTEQAILKKYKDLIEEEIRKRQLWAATEIRDELKRLTHIWKPFDAADDPKYTAYRYSSPELYADALSVLLNSPQMLRRVAPKFYEAFFSWLDTKPEVRDEYNEIQYLIHSGEIDRERTMSIYRMFDDGNDKYYELLQKDWDRRNFWDNLKRDMFDTYHYLLKDIKRVGEGEISPEDNPRYKVENMAYTGSEVEGMLTMVLNNVLKPLKEANLQWDREFGLLAFLERVAYERYGMANPEGWDAETALQKIKAMKTKELTQFQWSKLQEALNNFRQIHKKYFIDKAALANVFSDDLMKIINEREKYVAFSVKDYFREKYGTAAGMRVFKQIGTFKKIFNPATATILKDISFMHSVNRNVAIKSIVQFYLTHKEMLPDVTIREADRKWNGRFQAIQEPKEANLGLLVYLENGEAHGYYINKELAAMFDKNPFHDMAVAKGLSLLAKPFRMVFTELNYGFWLFNAFFRDLQRAAMSLPKGGGPTFVKNYIKGIKPAFRSVFGIPDDVAMKMQDGDMLVSIADVRGLLPEDVQVERLLKMYHMMPDKAYDRKILGPFGHMFNYVTNIAKVGEYYFSGVGRALERTTKVASYKFLKEKFPDMPDDVVAHLVRTRGGSPDFLRTGRGHAIYNNLLLFSNAMKEGYRGDFVAMKESPAVWWTKKLSYIFVPKMLMAAILYGFLDGDDDDTKLSKVMRGVSSYDFINYICIPIGLTKSGKSVYFRVPTDETSRLLGGILSVMLRGKEFGFADAALKLGDYMAGQAPTWNPAIDVVADIVQYAGGNNPYDSFYGRHAVDEQTFLARDARSHKQFAKYLMGKLGASIVYKFKYDDVDKIADELETVLGFPINSKVADWMIKLPDEPVASNAIGRFLKVSDYGKREEIRRGKTKLQRENARTLLDAKEGVARLVNGESLEQKHLTAMALKPDAVDKNMLVALSRRYGRLYYEEYLSARSKAEKWYVLSKMIADSVIPATTYGPQQETPKSGEIPIAPETGARIPTKHFKFEEE